ncbi:hypothetical protein D3C85_1143770 [compost metagenome]
MSCLDHRRFLGRVAGNSEEPLQLVWWCHRHSCIGYFEAQCSFQAGADRRQILQLAQVFADRLPHESHMKKYRSAAQFILVRSNFHDTGR